MAVIQETIPAGNLIYRKITGKKRTGPKQKRAQRSQPTIEEVEKNNQRYAARDLFLKLNYNYNANDWHLVFTYRGEEPTPKEAWDYLEKFKRALLALYRSHGVLLKWVESTEYENERIHHHIVVNKGVDLIEIKNTWGKGKVIAVPMYEEGNFKALAEYIIKETSKTIKGDNPFGRRRFRCSRSVKNPPVYRKEIKPSKLRKLLEDPKAIKGYYIDQDSVHKGVNPETERPYLEYVMLPIEGEKQAKKINGKKVKYRKDSADWWLKKYEEQQLKIDMESVKKTDPF